MDISRDEYWKPHVSNSSALSVPKISKAVAAQKKLIKHTEYKSVRLYKHTHQLADHNKATQ